MSLPSKLDQYIEEGVRRGVDKVMPTLLDDLAKIAVDEAVKKFGAEISRLHYELAQARAEIARLKELTK